MDDFRVKIRFSLVNSLLIRCPYREPLYYSIEVIQKVFSQDVKKKRRGDSFLLTLIDNTRSGQGRKVFIFGNENRMLSGFPYRDSTMESLRT